MNVIVSAVYSPVKMDRSGNPEDLSFPSDPCFNNIAVKLKKKYGISTLVKFN